ncbi:uncharacterized protein FIBRA_03187 [Fibroporia radiculosa]|uniref:Uncharacterized protein n=1 Tax=Fibroporia radiculosa TaxID=599839 RepID=J4H296_9APHY|nr:uncharacterized protein FIBRA_03187 [Fibroporia radiculosa]CCM01139.1 predicted protein [Fibroporia radiculosa]
MNVLSAPNLLWSLYVDYLWNYQRGSWVYSVASTFRVLAFTIIVPFVLLTLLDVASYVIARTLGVIDETKASTSETVAGEAPTAEKSAALRSTPAYLTVPPLAYFRNPLEEGNPRLSGVGMFSPTPSQPPSPTMSRRELSQHMHNVPEKKPDHGRGPYETHREASRESSSGESSYTLLEAESGPEDAQLTLRKRAKQPKIQSEKASVS